MLFTHLISLVTSVLLWKKYYSKVVMFEDMSNVERLGAEFQPAV